MANQQGNAERRMEQFLGTLLRTGVSLSAVLVLIGGAIYLIRHGGAPMELRLFHGEPAELRTVEGIFEAALRLSGRGIIQLGLLFLIATPVARVLFSVIGFARERDWTYVVLTLIVLCVLLYSLLFARF
jgi:uncharacterized membrane protein